MTSAAAGEIGILYRSARKRMVGAVEQLVTCGQMLAAVKEALPHGEWLPWLKEHQEALGFSVTTAGRLMFAAANYASTHNLNEDEALAASKLIWRNDSEPEAREPSLIARFTGFLGWIAKHDPASVAHSIAPEQIAAVRAWLAQVESLASRRVA